MRRFLIILITFSIVMKRDTVTSTFSGRVVQPSSELQKLLEPIHLPSAQPKMRNTILNNPTPAPLELPSPPNPTLLIQVHNKPQTRKTSFPRKSLARTERKSTMHTPPPSVHMLASAQGAHSKRLLIKFAKNAQNLINLTVENCGLPSYNLS